MELFAHSPLRGAQSPNPTKFGMAIAENRTIFAPQNVFASNVQFRR